MKKFSFYCSIMILAALLLSGCGSHPAAQIAATTLPVYEFTVQLCKGTPLSVSRLVTEEVSCLHDYSLNVRQVKAAEAAEVIVISGAGLEEFMHDILDNSEVIDSSAGIELIVPQEHHTHDHGETEGGHEDHDHEEETPEHDGHHHETDPHIWLSPANAGIMASNICRGLTTKYPEYEDIFADNLQQLHSELSALEEYGRTALEDLSCREIITFHDGFAYLAQTYDLTILDAIEEESGSEASAKDLIHMIEEVEHHHLPAIFTEKSGSVSAAGIISRETGAKEYTLDMAMSGDSWFEAMYRNINTLKEALQ